MTTHKQCVEVMARAIYDAEISYQECGRITDDEWERFKRSPSNTVGTGNTYIRSKNKASYALKADPLRQKLGPEAVETILEDSAVVIPTYWKGTKEIAGGLYGEFGGQEAPAIHIIRLDKPQPEEK